MNRLTGPALALLVLCLSAANGFASQCDGVGVTATQAEVQAQCCPARRHGAYVSCAAHIARTAIRAHVLSPACKHRILRAQCAVPTTTTAASTTTTSSPVTTTSTFVATTTTFNSPTTTAPPPTSSTLTATTSTTTTTDDGSHKGTTSTTTLPQPSTTTTSSTTSTLPQASTTTAPPTTTTQPPTPTTSTTVPGGPPPTSTTLPPPLLSGPTTTTTLPVAQEICGNCIDDDGDGVTDFEDPACCAQTLPLTVTRMVLKPLGLHVHGNRLKMKARYAVPALFDPAAQDTTLQIADAQGELFCQTITANHWVHPRRPLYRFKDKQGRFAGGLKKGRFKVKRDGVVLFRTRGKQVALRPTDGDTIVVTVRVGTQCARETMSLRPTKMALVFP